MHLQASVLPLPTDMTPCWARFRCTSVNACGSSSRPCRSWRPRLLLNRTTTACLTLFAFARRVSNAFPADSANKLARIAWTVLAMMRAS
jgi:hypothetical protein